MRANPLDVAVGVSAEVEQLIAQGRLGRPTEALRHLDELLPLLGQSGEPDAVLHGLYARALLRRLEGVVGEEAVADCDMLDRAATERRSAVWGAVASALRARARLDTGQAGSAIGDLGQIDLDTLAADLSGSTGFRLLDVMAETFALLRLDQRHDATRRLLDDAISAGPPLARAAHRSRWAVELATRALEPIARGEAAPEPGLLQRAVAMGRRLDELPAAQTPAWLRGAVDGVHALAAVHAGDPARALRLLEGSPLPADAARGGCPHAGQIAVLAGMHAHTLTGDFDAARRLDPTVSATLQTSAPSLVLEVCRARERLWLETQAGGDVVPVLQRLTDLLVALAWQSMDIVSQTATAALEQQTLRTESRTDPLTAVGNRRVLDEELRRLLRQTPLPLALILVDVDDFKRVNDRFTHVVGDEVLRRVAASLARRLRAEDRLARYGGDEFVVLLPRTGDQDARLVAARMAESIAGLPWAELADGLQVHVTTGCAAVWSHTERRPERDAESLIRRADEALLTAKRQRGGRPVVHEWDRPTALDVAPRTADRVNGSGPAPSSGRRAAVIDLSSQQVKPFD